MNIISKYRVVLGLLLMFSSFLVFSNFYVYQQQRISLLEEYTSAKQTEVNLLSELARESLISENYSLIEWFFRRWGEDRKAVIGLSLENESGFFLSQYQAQTSETSQSLAMSNIISINNESYKIILISDLDEINTQLEELLKQLIIVSSLATFFLGMGIWYFYQKFAILPLQDEVKQRELVEKALKLEAFLLKQANEKLEVMAHHDPLTGLRNRLNMEQDIEDIILQHSKHHAPFAVLMFDIDWFKKVNDKYGHDMGDFVLIEVAKLLRAAIRREDKVYRAGGEEFMVLLNRISLEDTVYRAEKIRSSIEEHVFKSDDNKTLKTISGGLYHSSLIKTAKVERILKLVDDALYESKSKGRNQITNVHALDRVS